LIISPASYSKQDHNLPQYMMQLITPTADPDTKSLNRWGNVAAAIRRLGSSDVVIRGRASRTLVDAGGPAVPALLDALHSQPPAIRLGVIETLGVIRDDRMVGPLAAIARSDPVTEVRWAATLALGKSGADRAVMPLLDLMRDKNRYVRFGAATALAELGWEPQDDTERAFFRIALQDWTGLLALGNAAAPPLMEMYRDDDPATRSAITALLGNLGACSSVKDIQPALTDRNSSVRWKAVLAAMDCGVAPHLLPRVLARRERTGPDPAAAALLNFLFLGIGYNYLGKWWGFPVFMSYMSILVLAQLAAGPFLPYLVAYPITAVIAVHTYYQAKQVAECQWGG
jgi:hypothetical protein